MNWIPICGRARVRRWGSARVSRVGDEGLVIADFYSAQNHSEILGFRKSSFRRDAETSTRDACATRTPAATCEGKSFASSSQQYGPSVFAIEFRDETCANFCRTNGFALVGVGAIAKTFRVHLAYHFQCAQGPFRSALRKKCQMRNLRRGEKHGRSVRTRRRARPATNTRGCFHCPVGLMLC